MSAAAPQRFVFDTEFDAGDVVASPPVRKRVFLADEVEQIRAQAFAEGERSSVAQAEHEAARAMADIAASIQRALPALAQVAHDHRTGAAELALAAAGKIAGAALEAFPEAPAQAALAALAREIEAAPRLTVRTAPHLVERMANALTGLARNIGFDGQVAVMAEPALPPAAFAFDWGEGRAAFDPVAAQARVAAALDTALAAEGLHAEPLIPASET